MPVKSLFKLATEAGIANIRNIDDIGGIPYRLIKPILVKIENPRQLMKIEEASPEIAESDAELWRNFIKRDIRSWKTKVADSTDPEDWPQLYSAKIYRKLLRAQEKQARIQEEALKAALNKKTTEKQNNQMQYIDRVIDPERKPKSLPSGPSRTTNSSVLSFGGGSRTKMLTGAGILQRAKREAREASLFSARKNVLSTPTHRLAENVMKPATRGLKSTTTDQTRAVNQPASRLPSQKPVSGGRPTSAISQSSGGNVPVSTQATVTSKRPSSSTGIFLPAKKRKL